MRNLKDIIQEVLVHQRATKDTKCYPYGKEIFKDGLNIEDIKKILEKNLHANDYIYVTFGKDRDKNSRYGILKKKESYDILNRYEENSYIVLNFKILITSDNNKVITDNGITTVNKFTAVRYCTEEECKRLDDECKKHNIQI